MHPILEKYLELLWRLFEYDIDIFSKPWMYYLLLIPAFFYLIFFIIKWAVLTAPVWLPFSIIFQSLRCRAKGKKC